MSALDILTTRLIQDDFQPNLDVLQKEGAQELYELRSENARLKKAVDEASVLLRDVIDHDYVNFTDEISDWLAANPKEKE